MRTHWQTHAHTNTGKHLWYIYIHIVTRLYTYTLACMLCILHIAYECVHNHMFVEWVTDVYTLANTCTHKHRQTLVVYIHTHSNTFIYSHTCMYVMHLTHCLWMCAQSHVWRMSDKCVHIGKHMHTQTLANTCGIYTYTK